MKPSRRGFITGLVSLIAAPAIVRVDSIMPVRAIQTTVALPAVGITELVRVMMRDMSGGHIVDWRGGPSAGDLKFDAVQGNPGFSRFDGERWRDYDPLPRLKRELSQYGLVLR